MNITSTATTPALLPPPSPLSAISTLLKRRYVYLQIRWGSKIIEGEFENEGRLYNEILNTEFERRSTLGLSARIETRLVAPNHYPPYQNSGDAPCLDEFLEMRKAGDNKGRWHLLLKAHVQGRMLTAISTPRRDGVDVWAWCVPAQAARLPVARSASAAEFSLPADRSRFR